MAGEAIEFSEADLQATAAAYDPKVSKAPIVIGHPKSDDPAKGWAVSLSATKRGLFASLDKVDAAFAESVRAGSYGTVSAKFYRPTDSNNPVPGTWYLRHIGFLGAHPPGVKGLDAPEFAEGDEGVCFQEGVAFGEWDPMTIAHMFRNLREWFIGQFGADTADKVLPGYDVRAIEIGASETIEANRRRNGLPTAFSEADDNTVDPSTKPSDPPQPKESAVTDEEAAQLREQNAALQRKNEELQRAEHERAAEAIRQENTAFAESMAREARIPSAMAGQVAAIGAQLQSTPDVEFGEGDAKKPMHVAFQDLIKALPPSVAFGETATRERAGNVTDKANTTPVEFSEGADPDRLAQDQRIRAYAKQHGVPYTAAAHAVMRGQ